MSLVGHPCREIAVIASESDAVTLSIVNYAGQNQPALRRVLTKPDTRSNSGLCREQVFALWKFKPNTQLCDQPHDIRNPPRVDVESSDCQDYSVIFPEIGSGEGFEKSAFMTEAEVTETGPYRSIHSSPGSCGAWGSGKLQIRF